MLSKTMDVTTPLPMGDFFGWKRHPFADTYIQRQLWMSDDDKRKSETIRRLLHHGKSTALYVSLRQGCVNSPEGRDIISSRIL
jgi:hypothetical protein